MLLQSQNRISALEEYQDQFHQEQANYVNQSVREKNSIAEELATLQFDIETSNATLKSKTELVAELEMALEAAHAELKLTSDKVTELDILLQNSTQQINHNAAALKVFEENLKEKSSKIQELMAINQNTEAKFIEAETRGNTAMKKVAQLDNEVFLLVFFLTELHRFIS